MNMIPAEQIAAFFATARERFQILHRRTQVLPFVGPPGPWTRDAVFAKWRFCNTFREDDRTTIWFSQTLRDPLRNDPAKVLFATVAFRWFNRISTGKLISGFLMEGPKAWDVDNIRTMLKDVSPVVTGAYIIKTPNGMSKLDGVLWCIEQVRAGLDELVAHKDEADTLQGFWDALMTFPYLGSFMAYQIVSDLIHTCWLKDATDMYTWAAMGPGSTRGLGWLISGNPDQFNMNSKGDCVTMRTAMHEIVAASEAAWGRKWTMQEVQHWLCEHDKYTRAKGGQDQKRKFQ